MLGPVLFLYLALTSTWNFLDLSLSLSFWSLFPLLAHELYEIRDLTYFLHLLVPIAFTMPDT